MDPSTETLAYYDHNAAAYAARVADRYDLPALREFSRRLPAAGRVLDAGCGSGRDLRYFVAEGFAAEGFDGSRELLRLAAGVEGARTWKADFRMLQLAKETYDGIWAHRVLPHLPVAGCQRVLATFFAALRPGGALFVSIDEGADAQAAPVADRSDDAQGPARHFYAYPKDDFASLIRQSGFQVLAEGRDLRHPGRIGFIARRI